MNVKLTKDDTGRYRGFYNGYELTVWRYEHVGRDGRASMVGRLPVRRWG